MTSERLPSEKPATSYQKADEWAGRVVFVGNVAMIVAGAAMLTAWGVLSTFRGHVVELMFLLAPTSVSAVLVGFPRGNPLRALWPLAALVISPAAVVYLLLKTAAAYSSFAAKGGDRLPLEVLLWGGDLLLWLYLLLIFLAIMNAQHARVQKRLAETIEAEERDKRIVILEQAVASLRRRLSERDGY